jgi:anti-sigma B factor antagonist
MRCDSTKHENVVVISVSGRLDFITASEFEQECNTLITAGENHLVINFEELSYISSAGLRSILRTAKTLKQNQGTIAICGLRDMVEKVFTISGFLTYLPVFSSTDEALVATYS